LRKLLDVSPSLNASIDYGEPHGRTRSTVKGLP
jgi:hypothetical protein